MHRQTQHGVAKGGFGPEGNEAGEVNNPRTYRLAFPAKVGPRPCPVNGCSGWMLTWTAMREHFWNRHVSRSSSGWDFYFHSYVLTIYVRLY